MVQPCDLDATELRRMMGAKEIAPSELLRSCLERIESVNPTLNAITATCVDRARAEAVAADAALRRGDALGALHGLPIGIKDLTETAGLRTTFGSPLFAQHVPERDERLVATVRAAGAIVIGKTNVPEFGAGGNTTNDVYGPTRNPFDPARICGGSSGGSAVALATSMVPLATGSDTGGSLRTPAAFCGVVGFRPSPGLVPSERRLLGWTPLSVEGPMGRTVADARLLLGAMVADDAGDPLARPGQVARWRAAAGPVDLATLRVATSEDLGFAPIDQRIRATFRDRLARIGSVFAACFERDPDMEHADSVFEIMRALNFLAGHERVYRESPERLGPNIVANFEQGLAYSAADVAWAHAEQTRIYRSFQRLFEDADLLLTPTTSVPPFPIETLSIDTIDDTDMRTYFHWLAPAYGLTLTGHPCISIPCGLDPTGTPFGLHLCGPAHRDGFLLAAAEALEAHLARDAVTARPLPDLASLRGSAG